MRDPGGTYTSKRVTLPYAPTGNPGLAAARCARCRMAWVRAVGG